jgi:hypothetical protein
MARHTSVLTALAAATIGLGLFITPADAEGRHRGGYWWDNSGYSGANAYNDEYRYPGIRWYDDCSGGWRDRHRGHRERREHRRHHGEWRYDRERNDWR